MASGRYNPALLHAMVLQAPRVPQGGMRLEQCSHVYATGGKLSQSAQAHNVLNGHSGRLQQPLGYTPECVHDHLHDDQVSLGSGWCRLPLGCGVDDASPTHSRCWPGGLASAWVCVSFRRFQHV